MRGAYVCTGILLLSCGLAAQSTDWEARFKRGVELHRQGDYQAAFELLNEMVRDPHSGATPRQRERAMMSLGALYHELGQDSQASRIYTRVLRDVEARAGRRNGDYALLLSNLATIDLWAKRYDKAEPRIREAISIYEASAAQDDVRLAVARNALGEILVARKQYAEAEDLLRSARATLQGKLGEGERTAITINNLAASRRTQGHVQEALVLFQEAVEMTERALGRRHPHTARALNNLAAAYADADRFREAESAWRESLEIIEATLGQEHPVYGEVLQNYAHMLRRLGRKKEAKPLEARSKALLAGAARANGSAMTVDISELSSFR